jgi:tetratricopeptide (TPR) repeat protein
MSEEALFPDYVPRDEERDIVQEVERVGRDGLSRAVLLYGPGGVGKTSLVRRLATAHANDPETVWLEPVDIDDSEYWLLSNLERYVADGLDPQRRYFGRYLDHLSRLPVYVGSRIGYETMVSHLAKIKQVFADCYQDYTKRSGKTVVIVLDTVEVIRGMYLLQTLTQWMKDLPATLFILAGRPPEGQNEAKDPIRDELEDPHQSLPVTIINLGEFTKDAALAYLTNSSVATGLSEENEEKEKLVLLTRGHPLWLAFTVDYLRTTGIPEEAFEPLDAIAEKVPYRGELPPAGQTLHDAFMRHLMAPYNETDFWHEALKRLAIVRENVNQDVWVQLMADRPLPDGVPTLAAAWVQLLQIPWIRPRANKRYVTLHDAVAEELAQRIIPMHDQSKYWRKQQWKRAEAIYAKLSQERRLALAEEMSRLDAALQSPPLRLASDSRYFPAESERDLIADAARLDDHKRDLFQLQTIHLYYRLLCNYERGSRQFLELMNQAKSSHDILFQDLLAAEIQRFIPGGVHAQGGVIGEAVDEFRGWLGSSRGRRFHLEMSVSLADYLIRTEKSQTALELLSNLPVDTANRLQRYRLSNLRGNAYMRTPGQVREAEDHFRQALAEAKHLRSADRPRLIAKAHKELGFYYRNAGRWRDADLAYEKARDAISKTLLTGSSDEDREEIASIQSNWAYVKGLTGAYRTGTNLASSAITVRRRLGNRPEEGNSWSVLGEVYRYERRFQMAWEAYSEAEAIFEELRDWAWLGLIYQEQAICLFQVAEEQSELVSDPMSEAKRLITIALDLCRDLAVRGYPSALNRAGRIYGKEDFDVGLEYLADGIKEGYRLSDGWFWFANLIEYVELCYRAWVTTRRQDYLDQITGHESDIVQAMTEYEFPDLRGRWHLLQGNLLVQHSLHTGDESGLDNALEYYKNGFILMAQEYVGSSGAAAVAHEFGTVGELIKPLPQRIRTEWQAVLRRAWSLQKSGATLLLAGLEELY